jgi:hypothetical protein
MTVQSEKKDPVLVGEKNRPRDQGEELAEGLADARVTWDACTIVARNLSP